MMPVRQAVIKALHQATQVLDDPKHGGILMKGADLNFSDIEIDSLSRFELIMHIEEALDIELDDDEISKHDSLNSLISYIENKHNSHAS